MFLNCESRSQFIDVIIRILLTKFNIDISMLSRQPKTFVFYNSLTETLNTEVADLTNIEDCTKFFIKLIECTVTTFSDFLRLQIF